MREPVRTVRTDAAGLSMAPGELVLVGVVELALDEAAIRRLAAGRDVATSEAEVVEILDATGGWAPAVHALFSVSPRTRARALEPGKHVPLAVHNPLSEALGQLFADPADRRWVTRLALFETITPAVATIVSEVSLDPDDPVPAGGIISRELDRLVRVGLLRRDSAERWRLPHLLRRTAYAMFGAGRPRAARSAHAAIVEQLLPGEDLASAGELLLHARGADDYDLLANLWSRYGVNLIAHHPRACRNAISRLPRQAVASHPVLAVPQILVEAADDPDVFGESGRGILRAIAHSGFSERMDLPALVSPDAVVASGRLVVIAMRGTGQYARADAVVARVEDEVRRRRDVDGAVSELRNSAEFHAEVATLRLVTGPLSAALGYSVRALEESAAASKQDYLAAKLHGQIALAHTLSGRPAQAASHLAAYHRYDEADIPYPLFTRMPGHLAAALTALDMIERPCESPGMTATEMALPTLELWPHVALVRAAAAMVFGDPTAQLAEVAHLRGVHAEQLRQPSFAGRMLDRVHIDLLIAAGRLESAERALRAVGAVPTHLLGPEGRLRLVTGQHQAALDCVARGLAHPGLTPRDRAGLELIRAAALYLDGTGSGAAVAFEAAVAAAHNAGTYLALALLPSALRGDLLDLDVAVPPGFAAVRERLQALPARGPDRARLVAPSEREQVVLAALATGQTLSEIAAQLTVSHNTIKKQTVALYRKLGVRDRRSAVDTARRLGLLDETTQRSRA